MSSTTGETPLWIQNFCIEVSGFQDRLVVEFSAAPEQSSRHRIILPPMALPAPAAPAGNAPPTWLELRQRILSPPLLPITVKDLILLGAWAFLRSLGNDLSQPFGTTEIKMVLGEEWRAVYSRRPIDTHDLQGNPWMISAGGNQYALLRPNAEAQVEILLRDHLGL